MLAVFHVDSCSYHASHKTLYGPSDTTDGSEKPLLQGYTNGLILLTIREPAPCTQRVDNASMALRYQQEAILIANAGRSHFRSVSYIDTVHSTASYPSPAPLLDYSPSGVPTTTSSPHWYPIDQKSGWSHTRDGSLWITIIPLRWTQGSGKTTMIWNSFD